LVSQFLGFLYYFILIYQAYNIIRKGKLIYYAGKERESPRQTFGPVAQRRRGHAQSGDPASGPSREPVPELAFL
jgi:hypothetical protein